MSDLKVVFIGCNPSLKNADPNVPFEGTKSGVTLMKWIEKMGLTTDQVRFMNLTKYATQNAAKLKKSDVNLSQFRFELGIQLIAATHGEERAFSVMISTYQKQGKLNPENIVPNSDEQVEADMKLLENTPMPKIVTLGKMATWGISSAKTKMPFHELPHPSGLNHKLNDKDGLEKSLADCKAWLYS